MLLLVLKVWLLLAEVERAVYELIGVGMEGRSNGNSGTRRVRLRVSGSSSLPGSI